MADADDYVARLIVIRDTLTDELEQAEGSALAAVSRQLVEVLAIIESVSVKDGSAVDDLVARRNQRRAALGDGATGTDK